MRLQWLILLLFFIGCQVQQRVLLDDFNEQLELVVELAREIQLLKGQPETEIDSWQQLSRFSHSTTLGELDYCLFYKPFHKDKSLGFLKIIKIKTKENCEKSIFSKDAITLENVRNIKLSLKNKTFRINYDYKELNDYRAKTIEFNIGTDFIANKDLQVRYSQEESEIQSTLQSGELCYGYDENCQERSKDLCDRCESGFSWGISTRCSGRVIKVCGSASCGGHNEVACLTQVKKDYSYSCSIKSSDGFCQVGKELSCDGGILKCYEK